MLTTKDNVAAAHALTRFKVAGMTTFGGSPFDAMQAQLERATALANVITFLEEDDHRDFPRGHVQLLANAIIDQLALATLFADAVHEEHIAGRRSARAAA